MNNIFADSSKHLDFSILVNLCPENVLRAILSDAANNVAKVTKIVPLELGQQLSPQVLSDKP